MHWPHRIAVLALALTACAAAERGALEPIAGPGITLVATHGLPDDTARLSARGVTADVTGAWSDQGESIEIIYRAGPAPATIAIDSSATWQERRAPASAAWDRTVAVAGNALGRPLLGTSGLHLTAGGRRIVQIEYGRATGGVRPVLGDEVAIAVPMPGGAQPVRFRLGAE